MKRLFTALLILTASLAHPLYARTVEVEVHGMTCAFCVDSLERKFNKMESISKVEVSLKLKKVRLETAENLPDLDTIKQAVLDAGFTPVNIAVLSNEKE